MYQTGRGVPKDLAKSFAWYNVAAEGGNDLAQQNRDILAKKMSLAELEKGKKFARELSAKYRKK
jgi:TPR repeat protein